MVDFSITHSQGEVNPLKNQNQNQRYEARMGFPGYECLMGIHRV